MTTCLLCGTYLRVMPSFSDIFFSRRSHQKLCDTCFANFEVITEPCCQTCYKPDITGICLDCQNQAHTTLHRAIFHYNEAAKTFFQRYKFQGDFRLRGAFDQVLRGALKHARIIPIPVSDKRLNIRGFNQVTGFLTSAGLSYLDVLGKEETDHQSHKTRLERLSSNNPFYLTSPLQLPDKVIIFDDIYTTGTTLQHAREVIEKAGATRISTFSLFR